MNVFEAAQEYMRRGQSLLVIAGQNYGSGSSRDWAAKGPRLLGVRAVLAESFERIHRSNLAGMGVLPLQFLPGESRRSLGLAGDEQFDIEGVDQALMPRTLLGLRVRRGDGTRLQTQVVCRLDTGDELDYFRHGGMLPQMLGEFLASPP
jgi:aconitate hydratase